MMQTITLDWHTASRIGGVIPLTNNSNGQVFQVSVGARAKTARIIPREERWLHDDPFAMAEFKEAMKEARAESERGETVSMGSFAQYLDSDD